ncbi:ERVV2 protein, partial [Acrocephalus arundinaceus]|nr:ERVV2 protein [Acrocephalus arundinaceus]
TRFHSFVRALLPNLGIAQLEKAISNISAEIELIANSTADALVRLQNERNSLKEVVFQNHMVLHMITAQMGGVCILINTSCCTYID